MREINLRAAGPPGNGKGGLPAAYPVPLYRGAGKNDQTDATLPASMYACECAYFSAKQLVLPLTRSEWERNVKRSATDGPSLSGLMPGAEIDEPIKTARHPSHPHSRSIRWRRNFRRYRRRTLRNSKNRSANTASLNRSSLMTRIRF